MDLLAITAQLYVKQGVVQEVDSAPGILALPAPKKAARGRENDFLFVHLTLSGQAQETAELEQDLVEGLTSQYFSNTGGVTSALRRAVLSTNERLLRHNMETRARHEGALTCAVLHRGELYSIQVGEGLAFLGHNFGVERVPVQSQESLTPLGRSAGIDVRFAFHQLQNGDMMLLTDPRLAHLSSEALAAVLVDTEIESGLESLLGVVGNDTARLLLVEFADELPSTLPLTFQHSRAPAKKPARTTQAASSGTSTKIPPSTTGPVREGASSPGSAHANPVSPAAAASLTEGGMPAVETTARRVASNSARGLSRFTAWLAELLGRLQGTKNAEPAFHWAVPAAISMIVPIVVAAVVTSVFVQRGNVETLSNVKQQMMEELLAAETLPDDPAQAQIHYRAVLALAAGAEELRPDDPDIARMQGEALDALDRIEGVSRLSGSTFYRFNDGSELSRITLREVEGGIAVLDSAANRVLFHLTDETYRNPVTETPMTIAFSGQAVGAQVIGELFDILWLPGSAAQTRDSIAMFDRDGNIFNYYPNLGDTRGVSLGNGSQWINPVATGTYLDRAYVLDTGSGAIWKYFADNDFAQITGDEVISFSDDPGLTDAVDFDIYADDGSLVVLYRDGRIRYYDTRSGQLQWDETTVLQNGLTSPLISPASVKFVGSGLNASLYVLDPGSSRLIQISRGGTALVQFRILDEAGSDVLSKATDFAITESPFTVFVTAGDRIVWTER